MTGPYHFDLDSKKLSTLVQAKLNGVRVPALIDSGAQDCFISHDAAARRPYGRKKHLTFVRIRGATARITNCFESFPDALITVNGHTAGLDAVVAPISHDLILGKTWLYDTNPIIDCETLTLTFERDKGLPTTPKEVPEPKNYKLLRGTPFNRVVKNEAVECFALFLDSQRPPGPPSEACSNIEIVKKFSDVFPEELPKTLPPERSVDHHIDLIPGSKPFSRAPYRLSKFETHEV